MTKHSQQNLVKFIEQGQIQESEAAALLDKCRKALSFSQYRKSTAVVIQLSIKVSATYQHRDYWAASDRLVAIIRDGKVVTIMLSRKNQINTRHLRTDKIFS